MINSLINTGSSLLKKRGTLFLEKKKNIYYTNYDIRFKQYLIRKTNFQLINLLIEHEFQFPKKGVHR